MMKKNLLPVLVLVTGLVVISCDGFVSKVQVKGSPTFHAPLGSKSYSVSKYISVAEIREMMGADEPDSTMKVYEYPFAKGTGAPVDPLANPSDPFVPGVEDTNMRFLVHYPLTSVDLDFSTYLENIGFAADISASMPSQNFTVPTIESPTPIEIDFNSALLESLNVIPSFPITIGATGAGAFNVPAVPLVFTGFETATFSAGTMNLNITVGSGLTGLTLTGIRILDSSDVVVASATDLPRSLSGTITVPVPLTGATFSKNMQIAFDVTASGATNGNLGVTPRFSSETRLSAATGVALTLPAQTIPQITIPAISDPSFVQATVGTGDITMAITPGGSVTGFDRSLSLTVAQVGGLNTGVTNDTSPEPTIPLADETINREAINLDVEIALSATNASFSDLGTTGLVFSVAPTINIEKFSSVTMKPGAGFEFEKEVTVPLSQDLRDWVTSIAFNEVGLKIIFTNGLPAGNNIGVTVTSTAFGINKTDDLLAQKSPASAQYSFTNGTTANPYSFVPASHTNIDYTFKFNPPGYNQVAGTMTLTNLSPRATFGFSLDSVEMVSDWETVTVDPQDGFGGTFPEAGDSPLDFSTLTDYLGEGLGFAEIPMYLYISGPELTATAGVAASYRDKDNVAKTADLLDAGTTINKVDPHVFTQTDNVISAALSEPSASLIRFADVMNDSPSDLSISYNIDIDKISLTKAQVEAGATLKADLVIVFPLAFKAEGATNDVAKLELLEAGTSDLLGREVGSEDETLDDVFNNLKSMEMVLGLNNKLGLEGTLILSALNSVPGGDPFIKEISMGSPGFKESILDLTKEDIDFIKTNNPFTPSFSLEIQKGNYYLQRNAGIDVKITLNIETDINYEIDLQGGK